MNCENCGTHIEQTIAGCAICPVCGTRTCGG